MNSKEMIESYVHEVGQHLPRRMRADIELELRSLLADGLEDHEDDETAVVAFLKELGSPMQFATQYLPNQQLIGPNLFPFYKLVGTIIFSILTIITAATMSFTVFRYGTPENLLSWWNGEMAEYVRNIIFAFGLVTLIFGLLERAGVNDPTKQGEWDPKSLRPVKDPSRIDRPDLIASIVASLFGIWILGELPGWIGTTNEGFFTAGYLEHIPFLVIGMVIEIVWKSIVLVNGRWQKSTRLAAIAAQLFDMYVLYRIIIGPILISVDPLDTLFKGALGVALVVVIIDTIVKAYKLITLPRQHPVQARSKTA